MRPAIPIDSYYMAIAEAVSGASRDPKTLVGCVILNRHGIIVSTGYNMFPPGSVETETLWSEEFKNDYVIHAEKIAIGNAINSGSPVMGGTLYTTKFPCFNCSTSIVASRIKRVVAARLGRKGWSLDRKRSRNLLEYSGIAHEILDKTE